MLFRRLGVDVPSLSSREFAAAYCELAKRYHPDIGYQRSHELMANINAARMVVLQSQHQGSVVTRPQENVQASYSLSPSVASN